MKKLFTIPTLVISVMLSPMSFADWEVVGKNVHGDVFYIDFKRIKKNSDYVYYWELCDFLKPDKFGELSSKLFIEADCGIPVKSRTLNASYYTQAMGEGTPNLTDNKTRPWGFATPESVGEVVIDKVCSYSLNL